MPPTTASRWTSPSPTPGGLLAVAMLLCVLGGSPARAGVPGLGCHECEPLPEDYTIDLDRCQPLTPVLPGKPTTEVPRETGEGWFFDFDRVGDGKHPVRVWVGVSEETTPYFAVFDGSKRASVCSALNGFDFFVEIGMPLRVRTSPGLPVLFIGSSFMSRASCSYTFTESTVGWLALQGTWAIIELREGSDGGCPEDGQPDSFAERLERLRALHAQGVAASRRKDFEAAERLWREARELEEAKSDLGLLLVQRGRPEEAEPWLLAGTHTGGAQRYLDLADVYWTSKHRARAAKLYRRYIDALTAPYNSRPGKPPPTPVKRALTRAARSVDKRQDRD